MGSDQRVVIGVLVLVVVVVCVCVRMYANVCVCVCYSTWQPQTCMTGRAPCTTARAGAKLGSDARRLEGTQLHDDTLGKKDLCFPHSGITTLSPHTKRGEEKNIKIKKKRKKQ